MIFENNDRIIFAGDSVTDMSSSQPLGEGLFDKVGKGYVRMVENMLAAWYPELDLRITNAGTSGNTSRDLLLRFERDVTSQAPDWVSICIGINDVWRQFDVPAIREAAVLPDEYERNVESMLLALKGKVKGIFILSPYYIEPNEQDAMRKRMDEYGAICRRLAQRHGCEFVDFQKMFCDYCAYQHSSRLAWDRVHPNQMGATLMAREFLRHTGFDFSR